MDVPKSGKLIQGGEVIAEFLQELDHQLREDHPELLTFMSIDFDETGKPSVLKATGTVCEEAPSEDEIRQLAEARNIPWDEDYVGRVIAWWASDERVDRHGDIVRQSWNFENFLANPIILYGHDWDLPPIGVSLKEEIVHRKDGVTDKAGHSTHGKAYEGPALRVLPLFATAEQWGWADTVFRMAKARFLRTGSVSFYPGTIIIVEDEDERSDLGLGRRGVIFEDNELLEFTIASVPANVGAHQILASMQQRGLLQPRDIQPIRELVRRQIKRGRNDASEWRERDATWRSIWSVLYPEVQVPEHCELDVPLLLQEIGVQHVDRHRGAGTIDDLSWPMQLDSDTEDRVGALVKAAEIVALGDCDAVTRPFPNEHACRVRPPGDFQADSFRRMRTSSDGKRLDLILGRIKGKDVMTLQAFRYPKKAWSVPEARSHCKAHDGQQLEPASEDDGATLEGIMQRLDGLADDVSELRAVTEDIRAVQESAPELSTTEDSVGEALRQSLQMTDEVLPART